MFRSSAFQAAACPFNRFDLESLSAGNRNAGNASPERTFRPKPADISAPLAIPPIPAPKANTQKQEGPLDVIDSLDATSRLLGSGYHHGSPYDPASSHRNKDTSQQAPMAAFRSRSQREPSLSKRSPTTGVSARAQAAMAAMDDTDLSNPSSDHLLPPTPTSASSSSSSFRVRRNSGSGDSIHLGFPAPKLTTSSAYPASPVSASQRLKAQQFAETFGIQDSEAWEDFGRSRYSAPVPREAARESTYDWKASEGQQKAKQEHPYLPISKEQRAMRAASVWDMEATLREGAPVAAVPPVPSHLLTDRPKSTSQPDNLSPPPSNPNAPKRSKSLIQRIRKARSNPHAPLGSDAGEEQSPSPPSLPRSASHLSLRELSLSASPPPTSSSSTSLARRSPIDIRKSQISAPTPVQIPDIDTIDLVDARATSPGRVAVESNRSLAAAQVQSQKSLSRSVANGTPTPPRRPPRPDELALFHSSNERDSVTFDFLNDFSDDTPNLHLTRPGDEREVEESNRSSSLRWQAL